MSAMTASASDRPVVDVFLPGDQPGPRLSRRGDDAHALMLSRLLDERDEMPRLDAAMFNSAL